MAIAVGRLGGVLRGGWAGAVWPLAALVAFQAVGEVGLICVAALAPLAYGAARAAERRRTALHGTREAVRRPDVEAALDRFLATARAEGRETACLVVAIDGYEALSERLGDRACEALMSRIRGRLAEVTRERDCVGRLNGASFAAALHPVAGLDLEILLQIAARLQAAIAEPAHVDALSLRLSASVGFCQSGRLPGADGARLLDAAEAAMVEARHHGAGSLRAYSVEIHRRRTEMDRLVCDARDALEEGQIVPWFQPQVSTDTGEVTGFEALARWIHPERGLVSPGDFLPALERAGLMGRLGEVMLRAGLQALVEWDRAGLSVPSVGLNLSLGELQDPRLADRIAWELDRVTVAPERLNIEILETVIAHAPDDAVCRSIAALCRLGCRIDLDDFGTGNASITSIRRFGATRLKIDRSFVRAVDRDPEQQQMVAAILAMAERLGLATLAEGVETAGEHALLAQLGCGHVQGFAVARPMPAADVADWLRGHDAALATTDLIGRRTG